MQYETRVHFRPMTTRIATRPTNHKCSHEGFTFLGGAAVGDLDLLGGLARGRAEGLDLLDEGHAVNDLAKDDVLVVEPRAGHEGDEELRAVRCAESAYANCKLSMDVLLGPALAMERRPGSVWRILKFSSLNFSP